MTMSIRQNIIALRSKYNLTQLELAKIAGVSRGAVSQWEGGFSEPRMGAIQRIADHFGITKSSIIEDGGMSLVSPSGMVDMPLYGSIAAGTPIDMMEADGTCPVPAGVAEAHPGAFLLRVEGDSMDRVLPNGCYAVVAPCKEVEHDGKPYAVCVNGYAATIKRVRRLAHGFMLVPDSTDPTYRPKTYDYNDDGTEEITVIGEVVYYVLPLDWEF